MNGAPPTPRAAPRAARWADLPRLRLLLARAYAADPLMAWTFPDAASREESVAAWLGLFLEASLAVEAVDIVVERDDDERALAVAAWRTPGAPSGGAGAPTAAGLLRALVGPEHARVVGGGLAALRPHAPVAPGSYLQLLAVDPDHQRCGLGRAVLARGLVQAEGAGLGVHLETANPAAVPFYEALGFAVTAELDLATGGPRLWVLHRPARETVREVGRGL